MSYFDQHYLLQHGFFKFFVKKKMALSQNQTKMFKTFTRYNIRLA